MGIAATEFCHLGEIRRLHLQQPDHIWRIRFLQVNQSRRQPTSASSSIAPVEAGSICAIVWQRPDLMFPIYHLPCQARTVSLESGY
jgi:hypothetical protein